MSRWISWVRPLAPVRSRRVRVWVARGSIAYSAVTHPAPLALRQCGTPSTTEAAHRTRVFPAEMMHEPSAYPPGSVSMVRVRRSSARRPWRTGDISRSLKEGSTPRA